MLTRVMWIVWMLMGAVYATMLLWSLPHLTRLAGGLPMFDMRPSGYSLAEAQAVLFALGQEGRAFYAGVQHKLDTIFPALEALALSLAFWRLFPRLIAVFLSGIALAGAAFDWLENAAVAGLLRVNVATVSADQVAVASQWTMLKSGAVTVSMTTLLIGLGLAIWRKFRRRAA